METMMITVRSRLLAAAIMTLTLLSPSFVQGQQSLLGSGEATPTLNSGDTAWMLAASALVLLMLLPGIPFFYGGWSGAKMSSAPWSRPLRSSVW
jgi:hypothetical protein